MVFRPGPLRRIRLADESPDERPSSKTTRFSPSTRRPECACKTGEIYHEIRGFREESGMKIYIFMIVILFLSAGSIAVAEDSFDGTKTLLCASIEAIDCTLGDQCEKGLPDVMGAPQFMRIDFAKKEIAGPKRTTAIRLMEKSDEQLTLQGSELRMGWTIVLHRATGKMTVTLAGGDQAIVIFGACTAP